MKSYIGFFFIVILILGWILASNDPAHPNNPENQIEYQKVEISLYENSNPFGFSRAVKNSNWDCNNSSFYDQKENVYLQIATDCGDGYICFCQEDPKTGVLTPIETFCPKGVKVVDTGFPDQCKE